MQGWTVVFFIFMVLQSLDPVTGHARLMEPPSRSSMWRFGFENPVDLQDNEGFCGGLTVQWHTDNEGRCGVCGDQADLEHREHEAPGGKYANGIIVRDYEMGQVVNVTVEVTANHKGFFTFRICPNDDINQDPLQDCFDQPEHLLKVLPDLSNSYPISDDVGLFDVSVQLPEDLECEQCILQWTYTCGNNWGCGDDGECGVGFGIEQETFRACADISIGQQTEETTSTREQEVTETSRPIPSTTEDSSTAPPATTSGASGVGDCCPVGAFADVSGMVEWCNDNCHSDPPTCPPTHCACD